ncbi:hypothetical protein VIGAN_05195900 [Vigna angularis var. angularis]|uniref:R13L1/DRL21-like LRR repeat region domain-containing protein n=1 Tax=Vigna angularis var. angularis TaxID=157739 RepID=A0A0S3S6L4_PHAAN|nr:hypothetical protein VIGAN_05195900 [Vigna angularis var. angularis]
MPKLQILKLKSCPSLEMPKTLTQLQDLRHVMIDECVETPPNISKLRNLRTLGIFVAGSKPRCGLRELHSLKMGGTLRTKGFENVPNERDAKQENLIDKKDLNILQLSWGDDSIKKEKSIMLKVVKKTPTKALRIDESSEESNDKHDPIDENG